MDETLLENLKNANTELNKVTSERDRYVRLYEQATQKLSESHAAKEDLKAQVHALKEEHAALRRKLQESKRENKELTCAVDAWAHEHENLQQEFDDLAAAYHDATTSPSGVQGTSMRLPERPKSSHKSSSKREHKEERARKSDKESREKRSEKERLSRRFDQERPGSRRQSFIEPWGPGARPVSSAPARDMPVQAVQPSHSNVAFSTVPRTSNPLGSSLYKPGGGCLYDDEVEDGNYHAYRVAR